MTFMDDIIEMSNGREPVNLVNPIRNGSEITVGEGDSKIVIRVSKHFNWFQKKMIKFFFGFAVEDYDE